MASYTSADTDEYDYSKQSPYDQQYQQANQNFDRNFSNNFNSYSYTQGPQINRANPPTQMTVNRGQQNIHNLNPTVGLDRLLPGGGAGGGAIDQYGINRSALGPQGFAGNSGNIGMGLNPSTLSGNFSHPGYQYDQSSLSRFLSPQQISQSREEEFTIQNEDFPALPGSSAPTKNPNNADSNREGILNGSTNSYPGQGQQLPYPQVGSSSSNIGGVAVGGNLPGQSQKFPSNLPGTSPVPSNITRNVSNSSTGGPSGSLGGGGVSINPKDPKYGLLGLLDVVKMTDKDLNILSLGQDLTTFGLSLNSTECLYSSFSSPFVDSSNSEHAYTTPSCYINHTPSFKVEHLTKIQMETLFYMFYSMPKDIMQAYAAQELYRREWRFHSELKLWLKVLNPQDTANPPPYVYFDINSWEQRPFAVSYRGNIRDGFISEEDIRVRNIPPTTGQNQGPPPPTASSSVTSGPPVSSS